jgi:hypothetical protein
MYPFVSCCVTTKIRLVPAALPLFIYISLCFSITSVGQALARQDPTGDIATSKIDRTFSAVNSEAGEEPWVEVIIGYRDVDTALEQLRVAHETEEDEVHRHLGLIHISTSSISQRITVSHRRDRGSPPDPRATLSQVFHSNATTLAESKYQITEVPFRKVHSYSKRSNSLTMHIPQSALDELQSLSEGEHGVIKFLEPQHERFLYQYGDTDLENEEITPYGLSLIQAEDASAIPLPPSPTLQVDGSPPPGSTDSSLPPCFKICVIDSGVSVDHPDLVR